MAVNNIRPISRQWLAEIEIYSIDDLRRVGATAAWSQIKARHPELVTTNLLGGLVGAELDLDWHKLPAEAKARALAEVNKTVDIRQ